MFPSPTLPADPKEQKLLGLYAQRDTGLFMLRVKAPGGR
jgi:sulfite reductase beta subunit-like hemoprotein